MITPILLTTSAFLLLLIFLVLLRINRNLSHITFHLTNSKQSNTSITKQLSPEPGDISENLSRSQFAQFLKEDSERMSLPKKEQFSAYRKWRKEKGLNWHPNDEPSQRDDRN